MNCDSIRSVYRIALKRGFRFLDQDGNVLRKKATTPYTHAAINYWSDGVKFISFHSTANPSKHRQLTIDRIIPVQEAELGQFNDQPTPFARGNFYSCRAERSK